MKMQEIINWMIGLFPGFFLKGAISFLAAKLRKDKALIYALQAYRAGAPFIKIIEIYAANTETKEDDAVVKGLDEIEAELKTRSFRDFTGRYLAHVPLPDFDGDPTNDISVQQFFDRVTAEVVGE